MILGSITMFSFFFTLSSSGYHMTTGPEETMMWGMMGFWSFGLPFIGAMVSLASGIIVIISAIKLYNTPQEATIWGSLIIIFSVVSLLGMGGFLIGFILGLVGGILSLTLKQS